MKLFALTILVFTISLSGLRAQDLKGSVFSEKTNLPLQNAIIIIDRNQTSTDSLGNFRLSLKPGQYTLSVNFIGYKTYRTTLNVPALEEIKIYLLSAENQLEDVVVSTGYQNIPKDRATGSFSKVDNATFNQQVTPGILARLEGITPALTVDRRTTSPSIMIRGLSTLRSDKSPLIVVDQFPYQGDINNINPADVEDITILKDAAAASIWGAKAGNGVIVITTKKGKFNQPLSIQASATTSLLSTPDLSYGKQISAGDQINVERMLFSKGYYTSAENSTSRTVLSPVVELLIQARDGKITSSDLENRLAYLSSQDLVTNYSNAFYKRAVNQQYNLSMQGGNNVQSWLFSGGYDNNSSALSAKYERVSLKFENTIKLAKNLEGGIGLNYTQNNTQSGRLSLASLTTASGVLPSYTQFLDANGQELEVMKTYSNRYTSSAGGGNLLDWKYFPISEGENTKTFGRTNDFIANFRLAYQLLKGLKLSLNYQYENQKIAGETDYKLESYYTRNYINLFTQISGSTVTRVIPLGGILDENDNELNVHNARGQLNYTKTINDFSLDVLAGGEVRSARGESSSFRSYGVDAETKISSLVDYYNSYKNFVTGSAGYILDKTSHDGSVQKYVSLYANGALSYKGKYTLSASARRDASNLFGVSVNNLWNPLWSAGISWLLSAEDFASSFPYLRLRATYGSSGNSDSRFSAVTTTSYNGVSTYTRMPMSFIFNYANPDLKWEVTKTLNAAIDFKFFQNRLSGSVEYYRKKSVDLIGTEPIDYTIGVGTTVTRNTASISARGVDIELRSLNTTGAFRWNTDFFLNFYKDRVDQYYLATLQGNNFVNGNSTISGLVGNSVYSVFGYKWAGLNPTNGNPRGYVNGVLSEDYGALVGSNVSINDLTYVGPAFPVSTGALGNSFTWKDFNLNFRISYKFGSYFRRPSLTYANLYASRNGHSEYANRWQAPGDELVTNVPSQVYPAVGNRDVFYNYSEATILSGDLIRFQYVGFGYNFSRLKYKGLPFKNVSLQLTANNLGLLWSGNNYHIDPDYPADLPEKIYSFNLKINL